MIDFDDACERIIVYWSLCVTTRAILTVSILIVTIWYASTATTPLWGRKKLKHV